MSTATETASNGSRLPAVQQPVQLIATGDSWWNDQAQFELIQRAAKMFASSPLVPQQFQGSNGLGSCVIALNMAQRMGADPLMVMQNLYVVHGRPSWSSQFLIACFNQTGRFTPLRYTWSGDEGNDDWGCQAWSTDRESGERIDGPLITISMAKKEGWYSKNGSKWQTIPRLMLMYRAAAWLVRTHAPEIAMGLQTAEETRDVGPETIESTARVTSVSQLAEQIQQTTPENNESESESGDDPKTQGASSPSLAFLTGESVTDWSKRVLSVIQAADSVEQLGEINTELDRMLESEEISGKRHGEMVSALNAQASQISA